MPEPRRSSFGRLLRHWRTLRRLSQLALSLRVKTTTRHLSFMENGRSRPRREMVLRLAGELGLPLRARNELLGAAGLEPEFPESELRAPTLMPYRRAITRTIEVLDPVPAFVMDGAFQLRDANRAGRLMVPAFVEGAPFNMVDAFLAPGPGRDQIVNFAEVAWSWHARVVRAAASTRASREIEALLARVEEYLRHVPRPVPDASGELALCPSFRIGDQIVRTIGMTLQFGPSRDVTLEELSIDILFPRDDETEVFFRRLAAQ